MTFSILIGAVSERAFARKLAALDAKLANDQAVKASTPVSHYAGSSSKGLFSPTNQSGERVVKSSHA